MHANIVILRLSFCFIVTSLSPALLLCQRTPKYKVIIDPGHGGANIIQKGKLIKSERWDPITQSYLSYYSVGMEADGYQEHLLMLDLAKRLKAYLDLTTGLGSWRQFEKILRAFSPSSRFPHIGLEAELTRKSSWNHLYDKADRQKVNDAYRLYDYPDEQGILQPGRLSWINARQASLVVSLHMTPAGRGNRGGMAGVLAPGFRSYDLIRRMHLGHAPRKTWKKSVWYGKILATEQNWNQFALMRADAWGYFHGYRSNRRGTAPNMSAPRGIRHNLISWAYKESEDWYKRYRPEQAGPYALRYSDFQAKGKFWEREASLPEHWRREDGVLGYGGDNHYATDELLRFVQYGLRLLGPKMRKENAIGPIRPPFVSSYTLPIYVNAIVAFLEIGYLNRKRDRDLLLNEKNAIAQALAVGIYSLYAGIQLRDFKKLKSNTASKKNKADSKAFPYMPRGKALDFEKYRLLPDGDYFKASASKE